MNAYFVVFWALFHCAKLPVDMHFSDYLSWNLSLVLNVLVSFQCITWKPIDISFIILSLVRPLFKSITWSRVSQLLRLFLISFNTGCDELYFVRFINQSVIWAMFLSLNYWFICWLIMNLPNGYGHILLRLYISARLVFSQVCDSCIMIWWLWTSFSLVFQWYTIIVFDNRHTKQILFSINFNPCFMHTMHIRDNLWSIFLI